MERDNDIETGVKDGIIKESVDKIVKPFSDPAASIISDKFIASSLKADLTGPVIHDMMQSIFTYGLAELICLAGTTSPEAISKKTDLAARFMRGYAAENAGESLVNHAVNALSLVTAAFDHIPEEDLEKAVENLERVKDVKEEESLHVSEVLKGEGKQ